MNQMLRHSTRMTATEMTYFLPKQTYDNPCTVQSYSHHPPRAFWVVMRKLLLVRKPVTPQLLRLDIPSGASIQLYKQNQLKFSCGDCETFGSGWHHSPLTCVHADTQRSALDTVT